MNVNQEIIENGNARDNEIKLLLMGYKADRFDTEPSAAKDTYLTLREYENKACTTHFQWKRDRRVE
jgi:hypothetical protein